MFRGVTWSEEFLSLHNSFIPFMQCRYIKHRAVFADTFVPLVGVGNAAEAGAHAAGHHILQAHFAADAALRRRLGGDFLRDRFGNGGFRRRFAGRFRLGRLGDGLFPGRLFFVGLSGGVFGFFRFFGFR